MKDSDSDKSPPQQQRGKASTQTKPFSLDSIREIEASLGNVTLSAAYPRSSGESTRQEKARATTNPGGREPVIPRVVEPGMKLSFHLTCDDPRQQHRLDSSEHRPQPRPVPRSRAITAPPTGPPPFGRPSSSRPPNQTQFLEVPRPHQPHPRQRPFPPQQRPGLLPAHHRPPESLRRPPRLSSNPSTTSTANRGPPGTSRLPPATTTTMLEPQAAPRAQQPPQARPATAVATGPSRSQRSGAGDPTIPDNPYGYPPPPPLRHNWNRPNRGAAVGIRDPRAWRTGLSGRPLGDPLASRPGPQEAAPWLDQDHARSVPRPTQEEHEWDMNGLGPVLRHGRDDRSTFAEADTAASYGSLSGSYPRADARDHQRANSPYTPDLSSGSTTSTPRTGTLDTPMSASALPVWGEEYPCFSAEEAAVVLQNPRPTTIYIERGSDTPGMPPGPIPVPVKEEDEDSEDDFS
ncbi:hypothetical protein V8F20_004998 [Naviculisporaceae sp. PSN 640]